MAKLRRILHPTDFSSASRPAFDRALALARETRAELVLLHILAPMIPVVGEGYIPPSTYEAIETAARRKGQGLLGETGIGRVFESVPVRSCMIPIPRQPRIIKKDSLA